MRACKNITEKMNLLKMCGSQIRLCLFTFWPIASKQLNSSTTINTLSLLGGNVATHQLWLQEVPGSMPGSSKGFYVWFFVLLFWVFFLHFCPKTHLFTTFCYSFYNVNLFLKYTILQDFARFVWENYVWIYILRMIPTKMGEKYKALMLWKHSK